MCDPIGQAIYDYFRNGIAENILIETNYTGDEHLSPAYFFRKEADLPTVEKTALKLCRGRILDVGAAAGCHSLILQEMEKNVTALDKSKLSAEVMKLRGIKKVICADLFQFHETGFDTIIALMNGTGIGGTVEGLKSMLLHLKNLLSSDGQIYIDSSDISYLFQEEDGSVWIELSNGNYFGEMEYNITYNKLNARFNWLFIDYTTLKTLAGEAGLKCTLAARGKHYDYLAQLSKK
jgi:hypothetical protein